MVCSYQNTNYYLFFCTPHHHYQRNSSFLNFVLFLENVHSHNHQGSSYKIVILIGGVNSSATLSTHCPKWFAGYPIHLFLKGSGHYDRDWAGLGKRK